MFQGSQSPSTVSAATADMTSRLVEHLKEFVFEYMIPNVNNIIRIDSMPLLYNGKIDKTQLKQLFAEKYFMASVTANNNNNNAANSNGSDRSNSSGSNSNSGSCPQTPTKTMSMLLATSSSSSDATASTNGSNNNGGGWTGGGGGSAMESEPLLLADILAVIQSITGICVAPSDEYGELKLSELGISSMNSIEIYLALNKAMMREGEQAHRHPIPFEQFICFRSLNELVTSFASLPSSLPPPSSLSATSSSAPADDVHQQQQHLHLTASGSDCEAVALTATTDKAEVAKQKKAAALVEPNAAVAAIECADEHVDHSSVTTSSGGITFNNFTLTSAKMAHLRAHRFSEDASYSLRVLDMIADTFSHKNILHSSYPSDSSREHLYEYIRPSADYLRDSGTSFIVFDTLKDKFVAGSFLYDYHATHLPCHATNEYFLNLIEMLRVNRQVAVNKAGLANKRVLNSSFMTTNAESSFYDNIVLMNFIEDEIIKIARENHYDAIVTVNTTRITRVSHT